MFFKQESNGILDKYELNVCVYEKSSKWRQDQAARKCGLCGKEHE